MKCAVNPTYSIYPVEHLDFWRKPILHALEQIRTRTEGRYTSERIFESFRTKIENPDVFALWLCLAEEDDRSPLQRVVALVTLDLWVDECNEPFTFISRVWGKPGIWERKLLQMVMPKIEEWATDRTAVGKVIRVMAMAGRVSRHKDARERVAQASERVGLPMGWKRKETIFERELGVKL